MTDLGNVAPSLPSPPLTHICVLLTDWLGHCLAPLPLPTPLRPSSLPICVWLTDLVFVVHRQGVLLGVAQADAGEEEVNDGVDSLVANSGQCCGGADSIVQVQQLAFQVWKGKL